MTHPMRTQQMRVSSQTQIAPGICEIRLDCEGDFIFQAGQYVLVHIDSALDPTLKKPYPRAYSIASFEGQVIPGGIISATQISLVYKLTGGVATGYLSQCVVGDLVTIQGPAGHYTEARHSSTCPARLVFCATGTGIAPIHCILKYLAKSTTLPYTSISLLWGLKTKSDLYYQSSFDEIWNDLLEKGVNGKRILCLSQEKVAAGTTYEQWSVYGARIQSALVEEFPHTENVLFSLCGSGEMVSQTRQLLLANGVNSKQILFERYS